MGALRVYVSESEGAHTPKKGKWEKKLGQGKITTERRAGVGRSGYGLQIPEVINNKTVSSRTPMMIWVKLFPLPPEVSQCQPKKLSPEISLL